jgi:hypothetical protein
MDPPTDELRSQVAVALDDLTREAKEGRPDGEDQLDEILGMIETRVEEALESGPDEDEHSELAAVDAWAGLASYAIARFYAPNSPWPWHKAGWDKRAPERLRRIARMLQPPLEQAARMLRAASWSVSVGFPWGISISVGWS